MNIVATRSPWSAKHRSSPSSPPPPLPEVRRREEMMRGGTGGGEAEERTSCNPTLSYFREEFGFPDRRRLVMVYSEVGGVSLPVVLHVLALDRSSHPPPSTSLTHELDLCTKRLHMTAKQLRKTGPLHPPVMHLQQRSS
eukprot:758133-Hanusia_phi.AAC.4